MPDVGTMSVALPKIRAFISIFPGKAVTDRLESFQMDLRSRIQGEGDVRWTKHEQLHLTLQFLGYVEAEGLVKFEEVIDSVAKTYAPFELVSEKLGCFPNRRSPRVLWVGLEGELATLQKMKADLDAALAPLGYVPEKREFHPHLTLARLGELKRKEIEQLDREIVSNELAHFGKWKVETIELMQSVLSSRGAKYTLLRSFPLRCKK